jgi:hypothetical protein
MRGLLPDLIYAGLSGLMGARDTTTDIWVSTAVLGDPESVPLLLRSGFRWSEHTSHLLKTFAVMKRGPWHAALDEIEQQHLGGVPGPLVPAVWH